MCQNRRVPPVFGWTWTRFAFHISSSWGSLFRITSHLCHPYVKVWLRMERGRPRFLSLSVVKSKARWTVKKPQPPCRACDDRQRSFSISLPLSLSLSLLLCLPGVFYVKMKSHWNKCKMFKRKRTLKTCWGTCWYIYFHALNSLGRAERLCVQQAVTWGPAGCVCQMHALRLQPSPTQKYSIAKLSHNGKYSPFTAALKLWDTYAIFAFFDPLHHVHTPRPLTDHIDFAWGRSWSALWVRRLCCPRQTTFHSSDHVMQIYANALSNKIAFVIQPRENTGMRQKDSTCQRVELVRTRRKSRDSCRWVKPLVAFCMLIVWRN